MVLDDLDLEYTSVLRPAIIGRQAAEVERKGSYWQGLGLLGTVPQDGTKTKTDVGERKPTDESLAWPSEVTARSLGQNVVCDKYSGPRGNGFVVRRYAVIAGEPWECAEDFGPEGRGTTWRRVTLSPSGRR